MKPKLSDIKYPLMFNQKVSNVISSIYNNIDVFAEIVSNYFKEKKNEDDLGIFCFLTFPSVFGSLINDKFCELACDFASKIFTLDGKSKLADALFESFWLESHDFNYFFWNEIRKSRACLKNAFWQSDYYYSQRSLRCYANWKL